MPLSECFVSVVAPIYNVGSILPEFIKEIASVLEEHYANYELILVNDGSDDETIPSISRLLKNYKCIRLLNLSKHFGNDIAITSGLDCSIGDFVVILSPLYDPCSLIPEIVSSAQSGFDIVVGISDYKIYPWWYNLGSSLFYYFGKYTLGFPLIKNSTNFIVLSRQVVNSITQVQCTRKYLRLISLYLGYKTTIFKYRLSLRYKLKKRLDSPQLLASISLFIELIATNSLRPLRLATYLSLLISLINLAYVAYIIFIYLTYSQVKEGWVTLSLQNSVMFFLISLVLTILAEYIGIILQQSKSYAAYNISSEIHSPTLIVDPTKVNVIDN